MENVIDERELLCQFREARQKREILEEALKAAESSLMRIESQLIESLQSRGAESTAKYEGVGRALLLKPRLYASYRKESEESVFDFLRKEGREEMIKPTVHSQSLSSFVREKFEQGQPIPEFISYYLKQSVRFDA